jgi:hypothetical protein
MRNKNQSKINRRSIRSKNAWMFSLGAIGLLALLLIGGSFSGTRGPSLAGNNSTLPPSSSPEATMDEPDRRRMELSDVLYAQTRHTKGDPAAPVTIIEFSDFQ